MRYRPVIVLAFLVSSSPAFAQQRVDPIPVGPEKIVEALSPFRGDPDSSKVAQLIEQQAEKTSFPASDLDRVLVARLWRRASQPELAMAALEDIAGDAGESDLANYEAARVFLESGLNEWTGRKAYWTACRSLDERVRAEIEWDLMAVSTPDEREAWSTVEPGVPTCDWLQEFWDERAQRMAIPRDERMQKHFARLARARHDYYLGAPRLQADMASDHGRPDGLAVDDRGLLYIRMGMPVYDEGCPEEIPVFPDSLFVNRLGRCWVYGRSPTYKIYYMTTKDRFGKTRPDGDFRIQESLGHQAQPGNMFFQRYVMAADIPASAKAALVRNGPTYRLLRFEKQQVVAPGALAELRQSPMDSVEFHAYERVIELATRRFTTEAFEQIPDMPETESTVDLLFETLRFLNPSAGRWQVWVLSSVRAGDLEPSTARTSESTLDAGGRYSVLTGNGVVIQPLPQRSVEARSVPDDTGITLRGVFSADPGPIPITVVIDDLNAPGTGSWIQDTVNVPRIDGLPQLSDIAVAQQEGGTWTRDGETYLQVSPAHITNPDGSIHTYFEVYGVGQGTEYDVELRLVLADDAEDIWRRAADDLAFRLQFRSEMGGDIGRHHLRLDLGDTKPGEYLLAVRIQTADTKTYSLPAITDVFVVE